MQETQGRTFSQYFAAISASLIVAAAGSCIAWPSPVLKKFASGEGPFKLSQWEGAWVVALKNVGNLVAPIPAGLLMARLGRRTALLGAALPFLVSWILVLMSGSPASLYVARVFAGLGVGMAFTITPVYLGEIAHASIRGAITTLMQAMLYVGILTEYIIGPHVSYGTLALASGAIPILFVALFTLQPESPVYLVNTGDMTAARKALIRLRGSRDLANDEIRALEHRQAASPVSAVSRLKILRNPRVRRGFLIIIVLEVLKEFSGNSAVVAYAAPTLSRGSSNGDMYTVILGAAMLMSTVFCSQMVDRWGRRPLLLSSCCASSLALAGAAFALNRAEAASSWLPDWSPLAALLVYGLVNAVGLAPIPAALIVELIPSELRETAAVTASASFSLASLAATKLFQVVSDHWGLDVVFMAFSFNCLAGAIFVFFLVPETKRKTLEEIQDDSSGLSEERSCC